MAIRIERKPAYGHSRRRVRKAAGVHSSHKGASKGRTESRNWFRSQALRAPLGEWLIAELDDEGNELPVKVVELNDEELAARCIARTRRPFLMNELQLWDEGVRHHRRGRASVSAAVS